jgi:uncharacterized repeat protein (TIGR03803 family)
MMGLNLRLRVKSVGRVSKELINIDLKPKIALKAFVGSLLLAGLLGRQAEAQSYVRLHLFSFPYDGGNPQAGLLLHGNRLYGTTRFGGSGNQGAIFGMNIDGSAFTNLHSFPNYSSSPYTNSEGANPATALIAAGENLYGTTTFAGTSSGGTIFTIKTNGTGFTNLHNFDTGTDGNGPSALVLIGNTLYGESVDGGNSGAGAIFAINTDGSGFTNIYSFSFSDGADPQGGLVLSGDRFYGVTVDGGVSNRGTIFSLKTDGTGFTNLHLFAGSDGDQPAARLALSGNTLYGTTITGGAWTNGTVFAIGTDGAGFTNLHSFSPKFGYPSTNDDGATPLSELLISGSILYGTTFGGGFFSSGTLFALTTSGTDFTALHHFVYNTGTDSRGPLVLSGNALYGTVSTDPLYSGSVFRLTLADPRLTITRAGANVLLQWPVSLPGFKLQSTTDLGSQPAAWDTVTSPTIVISGQYTVTNAISGPQRFYRLRQ